MTTEEIAQKIRELRTELSEYVQAARSLRAEARALCGPARHRLNVRRVAMRPAQRCLHLALAFLRGRPYAAAERHSATAPDALSIAYNILPPDPDAAVLKGLVARLEAWLAERPQVPAQGEAVAPCAAPQATPAEVAA